jgi:hypothetical protein
MARILPSNLRVSGSQIVTGSITFADDVPADSGHLIAAASDLTLSSSATSTVAISGNIAIKGSGSIIPSYEIVTPAGSSQSDAVPVTAEFVIMSGSAWAAGIKLPAATPGRHIKVFQTGSWVTNQQIYPEVGDAIWPGSANTPLQVSGPSRIINDFYCIHSGTWVNTFSPFLKTVVGFASGKYDYNNKSLENVFIANIAGVVLSSYLSFNAGTTINVVTNQSASLTFVEQKTGTDTNLIKIVTLGTGSMAKRLELNLPIVAYSGSDLILSSSATSKVVTSGTHDFPTDEAYHIRAVNTDLILSSSVGNVAISASQLLCSPGNASAPGLSFIDAPGSGIYEASGKLFLQVSGDGTPPVIGIDGINFNGRGSGARLLNENASATNPVFAPMYSDATAGIGAASSGEISYIAGATEIARTTANNTIFNKELALSSSQITAIDTDLILSSSATSFVHLSSSLSVEGASHFGTEYDNGNSGAASDTIDWTVSNKQKVTLTGSSVYVFTDPAGTCNLMLKLIQDGTGNHTATWPASVLWSGGTAPTLSTGSNAIDIVSFYFDGTNYFGQGVTNFF